MSENKSEETVTKELIRASFNALKSLRLHSSMDLFDKIFGEDIGEKLWRTYLVRYSGDWLAFWGYLDDAYKDCLLNYIVEIFNSKGHC